MPFTTLYHRPGRGTDHSLQSPDPTLPSIILMRTNIELGQILTNMQGKNLAKSIVRQCNPCTACCEGWVRANIRGIELYPGHSRCPHKSDEGCTDYDNRPVDPCRSFNCAWVMENSPLPDWMKPTNSKAIFVLNRLSWQGYPIDLAVPIGKKIPPRTINWLKEFSQQNTRLLLYTEQIVEDGNFIRQQKYFAFGPPAFQQQAAEWDRKGLQL
mgnify:CR=1 FL=1